MRLVVSDDAVPGFNQTDAPTWREQLATRFAPDLPDRAAETHGSVFGTLIPAYKK